MASAGAVTVLDAHTTRVIGASRYHGLDESKGEIEIGWTFLARSYWGGAYNGELKRLMLAHAFRFVDRVVFFIDPENLRSQRSVEKLGAYRSGWGRDGSGRAAYRYDIDASMLGPGSDSRRGPDDSF